LLCSADPPAAMTLFHLDDVYNKSFWAILALTGFVFFAGWQKTPASIKALRTPEFLSFQRNWLIVYLLAFFADWLQGPYVYALYDSYGYGSEDIAMLFIVGFLTSMVFGTLAGGASDKVGRKKMCILFAISYSGAAMTKMSPNYWVLMLGRFLGGLSTSLLFSVFEAWMVSEHMSRNFHPDLLGDTFGLATIGNGLVAIAAGMVGQGAADEYGYVAPFMVCIGPLILCGIIVFSTWNENHGDSEIAVLQGFKNAFTAVMADKKIMYLGAAQSAFEGAMYTFVFMWTPALQTAENKDTLPYGTIFAAFMVCCTLGSTIFSFLVKSTSIENMPVYVHLLATMSMGMVYMLIEDKAMVYFSFLLFETACGIFFPTYGTLRSKYIPEGQRAAVMNFFRIPLNAFVVVVLVKIKYLHVNTVFLICTAAHAFSAWAYLQFRNHAAKATPALPTTAGISTGN